MGLINKSFTCKEKVACPHLPSNGRKAFWDDKTKTIVITNPKDGDYGTAFKPTSGKKYFDKQK